MSKVIKTVASIALPIIGNYIAPGIGGAIGGAIGGYVSTGSPVGAITGAIGGYASGGLTNGIIGTAAGTPLAEVAGNAALQGPTAGSGIIGAVTGGGVRALGNIATTAATGLSGGTNSVLSGLSTIGNQLIAQDSATAAKKAAGLESSAINNAVATQKPYTDLGTNAVNQINTIQSDPGAYVSNNPFYKSLADDAQSRLTATEASKGKVGSGGTAGALQDRLLQLGTGLVQNQVNTLQTQAGIGQGAANNVSGLQVDQGNVNAAGVTGASNAMKAGYQNQINTLLALQSLNNTPTYQPFQMKYA